MLDQPTLDSGVKPAPGDAEINVWQTKLLPLMVGMIIVLTAVFCVSNIVQVYILNNHIREVGEPNLDAGLNLLQVDAQTEPPDRLSYATLRTQALLEGYAIRYRYHQASVASMGRGYLIYLGFTTGMVLAMVGATFILGKLKESQSGVVTQSALLRVSITSASPGLILAIFGTVLMLTTILARADVQVSDGALFVPRSVDAPTVSPSGRRRSFSEINKAAQRTEEEAQKTQK
jgi:hypothetical protein